MATLTFSTVAKNTILDALDNLLNTTGAGVANIIFMTATNAAAATLPLNNPVFNTAASGVMALNTSSAVTVAAAAGNASPVTHFQITDRAGTWHIDGDVKTDGTGTINLNTNLISAGDTVTLSNFSLVAGN